MRRLYRGTGELTLFGAGRWALGLVPFSRRVIAARSTQSRRPDLQVGRRSGSIVRPT